MANGHTKKEYGNHEYGKGDGTSDCHHGCGCWMGSFRSGGPTGLDPFGKCPKNPKDGKLLGENGDYDYVVTERIKDLESRLESLEQQLKEVKPGKAKLAKTLASAQAELRKKEHVIDRIRCLVNPDSGAN